MEVRFYPTDVESFVQSIDGLSKSVTINIKPYTKVWFDNDYQGEGYVGWIDSRLQKQFDTWIKSYS